MLPILEKLAIIQERDSRILALQAEAKELPGRKKREEARLQDVADRLQAARDRQKKVSAAIHQADVDIQAAKDKADKLRRQQMEIKSNDQYRALQHEIEAEVKSIRTIEDREIELMEQSETVRADVTKQEKEAGEATAGIRSELQTLAQREDVIRGELAQIEAERKTLLHGVDEVWLHRYNRLFAHVGPPVIVPVVRETCGGCHMRLSPQVVLEAKRQQTICSCTFCGRMLYWEG